MPQTARSRRLFTQTLPVLGICAILLALSCSPAAASNLTATDGRSSIVSIDPLGVISASVIGGDAALRVAAETGHEVVVLGYQGEPYLRIAADGSTAVNANSPARVLNQTRYGDSGAAPDLASISDEPNWLPLEGSGEVIWHDHRIHSMAAVVDGHDWTVSLLVDGQPTEIRGLLTVESPPSVLPWVLLIAALSGLAVLTGRRNPAVAAVVLAATAAVVSLVLAAVVTISTPVQLGRDLFGVLLTIGASLTCAGAVILRGRSRMILTVASAALSAGFLATMVRNLAAAVPMPAVGPPVVTRIAVSLALASMLATIVLAVIAAGRPSTATRPAAPPQPTAPEGRAVGTQAISLRSMTPDRRSSSKR